MKKDKIIIGPLDAPLFVFASEDNEIKAISMVSGVDIVGTELTVDTLTPRVQYAYTSDSAELIAGPDFDGILSADGYLMATSKTYPDLRPTPYGTLVWYYRDNVLKSKSYVKSVDRVAEDVYKINAISAIGLLDAAKNHNGGLYRGAKFADVLSDVIGDIVPYTVDEELSDIQIYGWLPYASRRANLHQLLFSCGVMIGRNDAGDMHFRFLSNETSKTVPDGSLYEGGNIKYEDTVSAVAVTEHSFMELATDEVVTEYDNTDGSETANHTFLAFRNAPLHDLETTGSLTIESSGVNWAVISGTGILTGKKYTHSTRVMTRTAEGADAQQENVAAVTDVYLVNVANSENVAQRVLSYYSSKRTVTASLVVDDERPGDLITSSDPYGDAISGFITSMESVVSTKIKANTRIITDYMPTQGGNNYTRWYLLSGSGGTWEIPDFVFEKERPIIQAALCGGGHGGCRGASGSDATNIGLVNPGSPGAGGEGGNPGEGGRVATFTIDCTGLTSFAYKLGAGGASDSEGGATTFGDYSSSSGAPLAYGLANIFTGAVYALAGTEKGTNGGSGEPSADSYVIYGEQTWRAGSQGADYSDGGYTQQGGFGGGAAVGSNGGNGYQGYGHTQPNGSYFGQGGRGGDGANAAAQSDATGLGEGGPGGHGGGGGGSSGAGSGSGDHYHLPGDPGKGGSGGAGGRGGPGFILIYA